MHADFPLARVREHFYSYVKKFNGLRSSARAEPVRAVLIASGTIVYLDGKRRHVDQRVSRDERSHDVIYD
jgi:hypothetical protein